MSKRLRSYRLNSKKFPALTSLPAPHLPARPAPARGRGLSAAPAAPAWARSSGVGPGPRRTASRGRSRGERDGAVPGSSGEAPEGAAPRAPAGTLRPGLAEDARARGGATCWGPGRAELPSAWARGEPTCGQPHPPNRSPRPPPGCGPPPFPRAHRSPTRPSSAQLGTGPGTARRRTGRLGRRGAGPPPVLFLREAALPPLGPGRGAGPPQPWNVGSRPAFVSRRLAVAPGRRSLLEPLCEAAARTRTRRRRAKPRDGRYGLGAHGALSAEPAGDLGECAWLPAPLLAHRLRSRSRSRRRAGPPRDSGVLAGAPGWGPGPWRFQRWSRRAGCRTPRCAPRAERGTPVPAGAGLPARERTGSEWPPRILRVGRSGKGLTPPKHPCVVSF